MQGKNVKAVPLDSTVNRELKEKFASLVIALETLTQAIQALVTLYQENVCVV